MQWRKYGVRYQGNMAVIFAMLFMLPATGHAQPAGIDAEATKVLKRTTDFLAHQKELRVETQASLGVVLRNGQKLQFDQSAVLALRRPDRLRAERLGELSSQKLYYDGKSLTVASPTSGHYATVPAPATLEAMLDFARDELDIAAPAADLIYKDAYERLLQDVASGFVVGRSVVMGIRTVHLAFSGKEVDWQLWVEEGDKPLPRKYVITSKQVSGAPEYTVIMTKWDLAPRLDAATFTFAPAKGSKKAEFLPVTTTGKR